MPNPITTRIGIRISKANPIAIRTAVSPINLSNTAHRPESASVVRIESATTSRTARMA